MHFLSKCLVHVSYNLVLVSAEKFVMHTIMVHSFVLDVYTWINANLSQPSLDETV
jgi:hypothetical protein